jgi:hypothetical protein
LARILLLPQSIYNGIALRVNKYCSVHCEFAVLIVSLFTVGSFQQLHVPPAV